MSALSLRSLALALPLALSGAYACAADLTEDRVRAYYAAWSSGNVDEVMRYFTSDVVYEDVATGDLARGPEEVRRFASKFLDATPGVKFEPTSILIGNSAAAVEWTMSGGSGADAWHVRGVAILQHQDGRIARATDYWDEE